MSRANICLRAGMVSFWLLGTAALAGTTAETFQFGNEKLAFHFDDKAQMTISSSCLTPDKKWACRALQALNSMKAGVGGYELREGGENPSSAVCVSAGGDPVVGIDEDDDETSFCRFSDGSMIDTDSFLRRTAIGRSAAIR